jgi:cytidylate kinase
MRLYVTVEGLAKERLERRAWREGIKLRELAELLLERKLEEDERALQVAEQQALISA